MLDDGVRTLEMIIWNAISFIPNFKCKTAYSDIIGNNSKLPFLEQEIEKNKPDSQTVKLDQHAHF